ncbi:TGS domain-containing protein [Paenibacillus thiaminolyticus]|uniref:TGS domain-containing protein n=1 Tax=Paenibacillus thiaminolyticus TaxID=49283 RepID=UPI002175DAF6|nr:TGS domain-containing protein [Paenibacillus thiaminolyticus]
MEIKVTFPDKSNRRYTQGTTIADVAASISTSWKKQAIAGKIDGALMDLNRTIEHDSLVDIITQDSLEGLGILRHSTAHVMAQAIQHASCPHVLPG